MQEEVDLGSDSDSEPEILEEAGACDWPRSAPGPDLSIIDDAATVDNTAHNTTNMAHLIAADPDLMADDGNIMAPPSPEISVMMTSHHDVDVSNHVLASSDIIMADPDLVMADPDHIMDEEPEVAVTGIFQNRRIRSESRSNSSGRGGPLISKNISKSGSMKFWQRSGSANPYL
jgi:hypothetical protein